jgi:hypothetical protein
MLAAAMSLNGLPGATVGAALMLVVGEVAANSRTVGVAAVQLGGTVNPPIEAAWPKPSVTGVLPPLGPTPDEPVDPDAPAEPDAGPPAPVAGANP